MEVIQTQRQRWFKYGANVVLSSILAILLAGVVVYAASIRPRRIDTTAGGLYSLRPQTLSVIRNNPKPVKIVSLHKLPQPPRDATRDELRAWEQSNAQAAQRVQVLRDLLAEYRSKGRNIEVDAIDTLKEPAKEDALIREVEQKYGGELKAYKDFLESYNRRHEEILAACTREVEEIRKIDPPKEIDRDTARTFSLILNTVNNFPTLLSLFKSNADRELRKKVPDYRGITSLVRDGVDGLRERVNSLIGRLNQSKDDPNLPEPIRNYMASALPRYESLKQLCDQVITEVDALGDLKLDTLRRSLQQRDPILVMGENDIRIIPASQIWKEDAPRRMFGAADVRPKARFAGEQMITSAIMAINEPGKRKVAFIRPGGPPLTDPFMSPMMTELAMTQIAQRLRDYNFEVVEKDISGQWAMQAQMRGMPAAPEPTDEQLRDAIWVVLAFGSGQNMMGMPDPMAGAIKRHLDAGGSALILVAPRMQGLDEALDGWGIQARADLVALHELVKSPDSAAEDQIVRARREQPVFVVTDYGQHAITSPLRSLEAVIAPAVPVIVDTAKNPAARAILPLPTDLQTWGESDFSSLQSRQPATFDSQAGDMPGPIFAGAVSEKGNSRLVVLGTARLVFDDELSIFDENMVQQGVLVTRFPGNAELFMNSVFWLAKMDPMIAISPNAMEVSRIRPMSAGMLNFWRVGLLLVGIPGAVIVAGVAMYFRRRD